MNTGSGIQFSGDGPLMSGTWFNPKTGHRFTVRDCFFQDGQFVIQTTDNQMLDYNTIQDYVQTTDANGKEIALPEEKPRRNTLPPEVARLVGEDVELPEDPEPVIEHHTQGYVEPAPNMFAGMTPEDMELTQMKPQKLGSLNEPRRINPDTQPFVQSANPDTDHAIIDRVLAKFDLPELNAALDWPGAPTEQLVTLVNVLGIDPSKIAKYYTDQLDMRAIHNHVSSALQQYIMAIATGTEPAPKNIKKPVTPPATPAKPKAPKPERPTYAISHSDPIDLPADPEYVQEQTRKRTTKRKK